MLGGEENYGNSTRSLVLVLLKTLFTKLVPEKSEIDL